MRIGIDAREIAGRATGVGRYLGGLLREWASDAAADRHEFLLYAHEPLALTLDSHRFPARIIPGPPNTWWEQIRLPAAAARDRLDVWFSPAYSVPIRLDLPRAVTIHDLSFLAHPEWFGVREGIRRRWLCREAAARAAAVITVSEFSKGEIVDLLNVAPERIHVIPSGVEVGDWRLGTEQAVPSPQPPPPGLRLLFVGSLFNRRHVPDLIRAFAPIARAHPNAVLDIVGDNRSTPREDLRGAIAAEALHGQIHWHEYVTDRQLHALYAAARGFAFLSEYEGHGLTPLEALAAGVPAVLADTPAARESCSDAALYVPVADVAAATRAIESLLFDDTLRARLLAAAPAALARYTWPRAARETLALLERCAT